MNTIIQITHGVNENALASVREVDLPELNIKGLAAPEMSAVQLWVNRIWDDIEAASRRAFRETSSAAQKLVEKAMENISAATEELGNRFQHVVEIIQERLNQYMDHVISGALSRMKQSITVAGTTLEISQISISQTLKLGGSLQTSIESVISFVGEGQISVDAIYTNQPENT